MRIIAVSPGARQMGLQAAKTGPPWGLCRLVLPIISGESTRVVFVQDCFACIPGTMWFTSAWRAHALVNQENRETFHLIVDVCLTAGMGELFPAAVRDRLRSPAALIHRPTVPLSRQELHRYECRFLLPETFINWERPGHRLPESAKRDTVPAEVRDCAGTGQLIVAGRPFCSLEHVGRGEFRFQGWSDERTIQIARRPDGQVRVTLRAREGPGTYRVELCAASVE
ncbi:hypothetical protein [Streptomyces lavendulocolor]|uniref:hypothetical protein n=1 Tax=Streptomyces lavendulocolor TaxID=67316 RepID=UPI003C2B08C3